MSDCDHTLSYKSTMVDNESDRNYIRRKCEVCGHEEVLPRHTGHLPSEAFATQKRKRRLNHNRRKYAKDLIQPVDSHGQINKDFKKAYGYNPFKQEEKVRERYKREQAQDN